MKLCKDCKHCRPSVSIKFGFLGLSSKIVKNYEYARCAHELSICVVSGEHKQFCSVSRQFSNDIKHCTPEARYFEPK